MAESCRGLWSSVHRRQRTSRDAIGTPGFAPRNSSEATARVRSDIFGRRDAVLSRRYLPFAIANPRRCSGGCLRAAVLLTSVRSTARGVGGIVAKCLAKSPAERYPSYAALRGALEPFGSALLAPAPIVRRIIAGMIDLWVAGVLVMPFAVLLQLWPVFAHRTDTYILGALGIVITAAYFGMFEGRGRPAGSPAWAARRRQHHVPPESGAPLSAHRIRPAIDRRAFAAIQRDDRPRVGDRTVFGGPQEDRLIALHDPHTTRVVRRRARADQLDRTTRLPPARNAFEKHHADRPYLVPASTPLAVASRSYRRSTTVAAALDELLPPGHSALTASARSRPSGRAMVSAPDGDESWDAFEAVEGVPFSSHAGAAQPWSHVRHWLSDLTREVAAAVEDGVLPALVLERVWVGVDGHARILERPAPGFADGAPEPVAPGGIADAEKFLYTFATAALTGATFERAQAMAPDVPLPLRARTFLLSLRDAKFRSPVALLQGLADVGEAAAVSRSLAGSSGRLGVMPIGVPSS